MINVIRLTIMLVFFINKQNYIIINKVIINGRVGKAI